MPEFTQKHRMTSIVLACLQNMSLGGIFYGWASISGGLLISSTHDGGPGLSTNYVHMIFVIASFCNFLGPLVLGIVLDAYGPRACSVLSILLITLGSAMFAISDANSLPLFVPGMCLIAFGGPGTQNAIIHLSNLFPEWKATATSFIVGSFQLSFVVFLIFDQLWSHLKYSYSTLFTGYCVVCVVNVVISLVMWPDEPYHVEEPAEMTAPAAPAAIAERHSLTHMSRIRLPSVMVHNKKQTSKTYPYEALPTTSSNTPSDTSSNTPSSSAARTQYTLAPAAYSGKSPTDMSNAAEGQTLLAGKTFNLKEASFNEQMMSSEFFFLTLFFLIGSFWANFYIGTFDMQLGDKHNLTGEQRHEFAEYFTLVITLGVVSIPPVGAMMDRQGFPATSLLCVSSGIIWALLLVVDSPQRHLLMASFAFYSLFRTSFYTFFFAYLADVLGFRYFGMLGGIIFLLAGVLGMLQIPLASYGAGNCHILTADQASCDKGNWDKVNMVMVGCLTSLLYFTYQDYVRRKAEEVSNNNANKADHVELGRLVATRDQSYGAV